MSHPKDKRAIQAGVGAWNTYVVEQRQRHANWRADLTAANVNHANLANADLSYTDLTLANLADANLTDANLTGANLTEAHVARAELTRANLQGADLTRAKLAGAHLTGADLTDANLTDANLTGANLSTAKLTGANLSGADLTGANLTGASLTGADLSFAKLTFSVLVDVDVSAFCAAKRIRHLGPSFVDARTVMRSWEHPRIKEFMLACGVPWVFAEYMVDCARADSDRDLRELLQSTFISYGEPDTDFARRVYDSLLARRITVYYFPETARWGERLSNEVHTQLNAYDRVILICSEGSLNRPGVLNEIQETFDREARDGGAAYLLPIALDDYLFDPNGWERVQPDMARRVRARVVGDFRLAQTDPGDYDRALNRLIDQLKRARP